MKTVLPWVAGMVCMVGSIALVSLLLFIAGLLLVVYGLLNAMDGTS